MAYAENTSVPADKSRNEIERTLRRYGAGKFAYGWDQDSAMISFEAEGRYVRFLLPMPSPDDEEFTITPTGRERKPAQAQAAWEQATRQRWRALALVIKAKLEAVEAGITVFEDEFLAHILLPNGQTVGDTIKPGIEEAYARGLMPTNLLALGTGK